MIEKSEVIKMIATLEFVDIIDHSEQLGKVIIKSDVMKEYNDARDRLNNNKEAQHLIRAFNDTKEHYEDVQRFGRYHPDYNKIMKRVRSTKREMDMNEFVAKFKVAERNLQRLLDEVSEYIAHSVSEQIIVPMDGASIGMSGCSSGG